MPEEPIFLVHNHQVEECGDPPHITDNGDTYLSYWENVFGEQWIFVFDRTTKQARVYCGDAGWEETYEAIDGHVPGLVMHRAEQMWVAACWSAAVDRD